MLLIALLIKLESPGPVFFLQERIGEQGRRFKMIKFRSMYQDAEQRWQEVAKRDAQGKLIHKVEDDPRVTRIGRRLRRTSLDELPQLINVLRGEMSLVGPRPEMPYIAAEYQPGSGSASGCRRASPAGGRSTGAAINQCICTPRMISTTFRTIPSGSICVFWLRR